MLPRGRNPTKTDWLVAGRAQRRAVPSGINIIKL